MKCNHKKVILVERYSVYWYTPEHSPEDTSYWDYVETVDEIDGEQACSQCGQIIEGK